MANTRKNRTRKNNAIQMGGKKVVTVGSRRMVWSGSAKHTAGGLKKGDLMKHKGRIVSRRAHAAGLKAIKRLRALGYRATRGKFVKFSKKDAKKTAKKRGGSASGFSDASPKMMGGSASSGFQDVQAKL